MALGSGCMTCVECKYVNEWGGTCVQLFVELFVRPPEPEFQLQEFEPMMVTESS